MCLRRSLMIIGKILKKFIGDMIMSNTKPHQFKRCLAVETLQTDVVSTFACIVARIEGKFHSVVKVVSVFHARNNMLIIL